MFVHLGERYTGISMMKYAFSFAFTKCFSNAADPSAARKPMIYNDIITIPCIPKRPPIVFCGTTSAIRSV